MKTKVLSLILSLILVLSFIACESADPWEDPVYLTDLDAENITADSLNVDGTVSADVINAGLIIADNITAGCAFIETIYTYNGTAWVELGE